MSDAVPAAPPEIAEHAIPKLPRGVRVRHDAARDGWVLLAPERVLKLDPIAAEVLSRVDGARTLGAIVDELAVKFQADRARILTDVRGLLGAIAAKRMVEL